MPSPIEWKPHEDGDFTVFTSQPQVHRTTPDTFKVSGKYFWTIKLLTHPGKYVNIWFWNRKGQEQTVREKENLTQILKRERREETKHQEDFTGLD